MTSNDVSNYELELIRSGTGTSLDMTTPAQQGVIYTPSPRDGITNQMVIIVLAIIIGVVAIAYSRSCNCAKN